MYRLLKQNFRRVCQVIKMIYVYPIQKNFQRRLSQVESQFPYAFISKLVPQPQLLVAAGFPTILNWLPINSMVKSTLLPFSSSKLGSSITTFAPEQSLDSNIVSSSRDISDVLVRDMRYWKPWHPPDSTVTRRARSGLESLVIIS